MPSESIARHYPNIMISIRFSKLTVTFNPKVKLPKLSIFQRGKVLEMSLETADKLAATLGMDLSANSSDLRYEAIYFHLSDRHQRSRNVALVVGGMVYFTLNRTELERFKIALAISGCQIATVSKRSLISKQLR